MAQGFFVTVGETAEFSKTLSAADVDRFADISGDFDPIHVDEAHARTTPFGRRIAHGILTMALLSTVSAMISARARERGSRGTSVSMGYDRVRFLKPGFIGDTPTFIDQGYDIDFRNWLAMVYPKGTSMDLARRWNAEANKMLADKAWVDKVMTASALTPTGGTPEDLLAILQVKRQLGAELAKMAKLSYD